MKRFSCLILLAFILGVISVPALSHPGRTDSNGGHYDRSTGEYHYHSGEYAGKTQSSSDNNSAKLPPIKSNETTGNTSSQNNIEPTNKKWYEASWVEMVIVLIVIALYSFPLVIFILLILYPFTLCIKKLNIEHRVNTYEEKVEKYLSCQEKHEEKEYEYEHFKFSRIPIPYDCEIGADGLPKEKTLMVGEKNSRYINQKTEIQFTSFAVVVLHINHAIFIFIVIVILNCAKNA